MEYTSVESSPAKGPPEQSLIRCILPELGRLRCSMVTYQERKHSMVSLPLDVVFLIADQLSPVERTMLWLTCRAFHHSIPMKGHHPIACPRARMRAMRLLYDSSLIPYFGHSSRFLCRTRSRLNVKKAVDNKKKCFFCDYFSKMGKNIHCPFHPPIEKGPRSLKLFRSVNPRDRALQVLTNSHRLTLETYVKGCIPGLVNNLLPLRINCLRNYLPASWYEEIADMAMVYQARVRRYKHDREIKEAKYYHEPTHWAQENWRIKFAEMNIWTMFTCNHCLNVFPNNSPKHGACIYCGCSVCGWSEPKILRVCDPGDTPSYILLGAIASIPR
ncbi:uncharacterized protein MCYG_07381 [Microsporum canis CBS 113480]|uniref:F-box domain-containing protein n=1 Tax=Arthroderma otae (strain ATCC MYA-4605 / CBS 113480) TaxID=554155 RepID=C5FYG4_ARTOC|nr:uncharacterized protein MCYG_07381 [Microsporum canis CBS 113480]EEQ34562.1 predicted protein [Microsporum canis CBS 113480]